PVEAAGVGAALFPVATGATGVTGGGPQRPPECAVELDLARRHAPRPQLLLEPPHRVPVGRPVLQIPGDEVEAEASGALRRTFGAGQHDDGGAVDVRAEPLLAGDRHPPAAEVASDAVHGPPEIRAAL